MKRRGMLVICLCLVGCADRGMDVATLPIKPPYTIRLFFDGDYDVSTAVKFQILSNKTVIGEGRTQQFVTPEPKETANMAWKVALLDDGSFVLTETRSGVTWLKARIPTNEYDRLELRTR